MAKVNVCVQPLFISGFTDILSFSNDYPNINVFLKFHDVSGDTSTHPQVHLKW